MATAIFVPGPTIINVAVGAGAWTALGYSDNDTLPSITFTDNYHEVKTVASGVAPEEIVLQNITAVVSVALVKWDATILGDVLEDFRGGGKYKATVGRQIIGDNAIASRGTFGLQIRSVSNGNPAYTFTHAMLRNDGVSDAQWGNRERVMTLNFYCIPNPTDNVLCTYAAAS